MNRETDVRAHNASTHPSFLRALGYALQGVRRAFRTERNMQRHFWLFQLLAAIELVLRPNLVVVVVSLFVAMAVFGAELINTAIEHTVDLAVGPHRHPLAQAAKDAAAGAVSMIAFGALFVGAWVLISTWPWHFRLFSPRDIWVPILIFVAVTALWVIRFVPVADLQPIGNEDKHGL